MSGGGRRKKEDWSPASRAAASIKLLASTPELSAIVCERSMEMKGGVEASPKAHRNIGAIYIGKTAPKTVEPRVDLDYTDPYHTSPIDSGSSGIDLLDEDRSDDSIFNYDCSKKLNHLTLSIWPFYRIWHVKQILAMYIGCPVRHVSFFDEEREIDENECFLRSARELPKVVYIHLLADWNKSKAIDSISKAERIEVMNAYISRDRLFSMITGKTTPMKGSITRTSLSSSPERGKHYIDSARLFHLIGLDPFDPYDMSKSEWVTATGWNDPEKGMTYRIPIDGNKPLLPDSAFSMFMLIREKPTPMHIHAHIIEISEDFRITVTSNWSSVDKDLEKRADKALQAFTRRIYGFFEEDIMRPDSVLPPQRSLTKHLSITAYRESFSGGSFDKFREIVLKFSQLSLLRITYLTSSSVYFQIPQGWSTARIEAFKRFIINRRMATRAESFTESMDLTEEPDQAVDNIIYLARGPEIQVKSEAKDIFIIISNCDGEEEIDLANSLVHSIAGNSGYGESKGKVHDYANLSLLEQIDPILFGSRTLPGGEHVNYSRECQGAARHPIPISIDEALKTKGPGVAILQNMTYGGPQAYRATDEFPAIAFRPVPFQRYCVVCCVQNAIEEGSLRWDDYLDCAKRMFFIPPTSEEASRYKVSHSNPIQFDGNRIVAGRVANFPKGVREMIPSTAFIYSPPSIDTGNLHEVIEWAIGYSIEDYSRDKNLYEAMLAYISEGVPITFVRMYPVSKKSWRASILDVGETYDIPPAVICMWSSSMDDEPLDFYPVVSSLRQPVSSEDLGISSISFHLPVDMERVFTYEAISSMREYSIIGMISTEDHCYALIIQPTGRHAESTAAASSDSSSDTATLSDSSSDTAVSSDSSSDSSSDTAASSDSSSGIAVGEDKVGGVMRNGFMIPIRPKRIKIMKRVDIADAPLPTVIDIDAFLRAARKASRYRVFGAKTVLVDERKRILGFVISPDSVTIYIHPSTTAPKEIDMTNAKEKVIDKEVYSMIWERTSLHPIHPSFANATDSSSTRHAVAMYLAAKIVRYKIVDKLIHAMAAFRSGEAQLRDKKESKRREIIYDGCRRFIRISSQIRIPVRRGNLLMLSERIWITEELYSTAVDYLAKFCPENSILIEPYFTSFGSTLRGNRAIKSDFEKIVT